MIRPKAAIRARRLILKLAIAAAGILSCCVAAPYARAAAPPATTAPADQGPSQTTATYGDWTLRCTLRGRPGSHNTLCEADLAMHVQGQDGTFVGVAFGPLSASQPPKLVIELPLGVWLQAHPTLYLNAKTKSGIEASFTFCTRSCFASAPLPAGELAALKSASGPGRMEFVDPRRTRISVPVPFDGLKSALAAGEKAP